MKRIVLALLCTFLASLAFFSPAQARDAGYTTAEGSFTDTSRDNRVIPYKLYAPAKPGRDPAPVIIFSHGLGGSTEAAPYFGKALAQHGYYVFNIQHPGSDRSIWEGTLNPLKIKNALRDAVKDPQVSTDRYKDLPFVIDEITKLNSQRGPYKGKLDLDRIGMAGHSFGARSVMIAAGEKVGTALGGGKAGNAFKDRRIKAAVALSPNVPMSYFYGRHKDKAELDRMLAAQYADIDIPLFHITGTEDGDELGLYGPGFDPKARTVPYMAIRAPPDQYLLVFDGAKHAAFGGARGGRTSDNLRYQQDTAAGAALFFDAYLRDSTEAKKELRSAFPRILTPRDHFEYKPYRDPKP